MTTSGSLFASAIEHHLELKRRNQHLDDDLPLEEFRDDDPFDNHPLFKTEADARREEEETGEHPAVPEMSGDTESMPAVTPPTATPRRVDGDHPGHRVLLGVAVRTCRTHPGHEGHAHEWMSWPPSFARPRLPATVT